MPLAKTPSIVDGFVLGQPPFHLRLDCFNKVWKLGENLLVDENGNAQVLKLLTIGVEKFYGIIPGVGYDKTQYPHLENIPKAVEWTAMYFMVLNEVPSVPQKTLCSTLLKTWGSSQADELMRASSAGIDLHDKVTNLKWVQTKTDSGFNPWYPSFVLADPDKAQAVQLKAIKELLQKRGAEIEAIMAMPPDNLLMVNVTDPSTASARIASFNQGYAMQFPEAAYMLMGGKALTPNLTLAPGGDDSGEFLEIEAQA